MTLAPNFVTLDGTQVWTNLERYPWDLVGPGLADTGAKGNTPLSVQTVPTLLSAVRSTNPEGKEYADVMWDLKLGINPKLTHYSYYCWVMFPTALAAIASQAIELDFLHVVNGMYFDGGLQADFADGVVRIWNKGTENWEPVKLPLLWPCPRWVSNVWIPMGFSWHRDASNVYYDSVTIGSVINLLKVSYPAIKTTEADLLNVGFQMDGNKTGDPYTVIYDAVTVTAK